MATLDDIIFNALGGAAKPDFTAGDPYAEPNQFVTQTLQTPILQAALKPDRGGYGTGELIGGALISGLLGGGLSGLSKDYQAEQKGLYRDYLLGNILGKSSAASPDLEPSLFDNAEQNLSLFRTFGDIEAQKAKSELGIKLKQAALEGIVKNPYAAPKILEALGKFSDQGVAANPPLSTTEGNDGTAGKPLSTPTKAEPSRGVEGTMLDEVARETQKLMEQGIPPEQASVMARETYKSKREEISNQYARIQESAKAGQELKTLADQMEYYLGKAGNTGFGGDAAQWLSGAVGLVSPSQKEKYSAGQQLESLGTEVIKSTGKVLKGPMSDADIRLLLRAGPRLSDEESANSEIISRWRYAGNLQDKYADFMRQAQNAGMPSAEAEKGWSDFVKANPYLIRNQGGKLVPNQVWEKILSGEPNAGTATQAAAAKPSPRNFKSGPEYLQAYRAWEASQ